MKKIIVLLGLSASLLPGCKNSHPAEISVTADSSFQLMADDYIKGFLNHNPTQAVSLGFHEYDGKLNDDSRQTLDSEYARLKVSAGKLSAIDTNGLSKKMFIDYRILRDEIHSELYAFENIRSPFTNPMTYARLIDANTYVKRNFAPIEDRVRSIIAIEKQAPVVFANAKANLADSLARPYVETAIQIANGSADFLGNDLPAALKEVKNDTLMADFKMANNDSHRRHS